MRKNEDYRTSEEKMYDFMYKYRIRIIIWSATVSSIIYLVSLFTSNKGGNFTIVLYPIALLGFIFDLKFDTRYRFWLSLSFFFMTIIFFILGFFVEI